MLQYVQRSFFTFGRRRAAGSQSSSSSTTIRGSRPSSESSSARAVFEAGADSEGEARLRGAVDWGRTGVEGPTKEGESSLGDSLRRGHSRVGLGGSETLEEVRRGGHGAAAQPQEGHCGCSCGSRRVELLVEAHLSVVVLHGIQHRRLHPDVLQAVPLGIFSPAESPLPTWPASSPSMTRGSATWN